jgi:hypothetical protein
MILDDDAPITMKFESLEELFSGHISHQESSLPQSIVCDPTMNKIPPILLSPPEGLLNSDTRNLQKSYQDTLLWSRSLHFLIPRCLLIFLHSFASQFFPMILTPTPSFVIKLSFSCLSNINDPYREADLWMISL